MAARKTPAKSTQKSSGSPRKTQSGSRTRANAAEEANEARNALRKQIIGVLLLLVGVLLVISLFEADSTGLAGAAHTICKGFAGDLAFLVPVAFLWAGLLTSFSSKTRVPAWRRIVPMCVLLMLFLGCIEVFWMETLLARTYSRSFGSFLLTAFREGRGTGLLGALTAWPLYVLLNLHKLGSVVVFLALACIVLIIMRKINLPEIGKKAAGHLENVQQHVDRRREEWEMRREEQRQQKEKDEQNRIVIPKVQKNADSEDEPDFVPGFVEKKTPKKAKTPPSPAEPEEAEDTPAAAEPEPEIAQEAEPVDSADAFFAADEEIHYNSYYDSFSDAPSAFEPEPLPEEEAETAEPEEYIPGSRLIEKEHVYKHRPSQPLPSYSAENTMHAPLHTNMLADDDEVVDILPEEEEKPASLFGDRVRRANSAYDTAKNDDGAEEKKPMSPFGPGIASGAENRLFSDNPIFGVKKPQSAVVVEEYNYPPVDLLGTNANAEAADMEEQDKAKGKRLVEVLESFRVKTRLSGITHGPSVTRFEVVPAPGVKIANVANLADDIALALAVPSVYVAAVPGRSEIGLEVPNAKRETVALRDVLESHEGMTHPSRIAAAIGRDNSGRNIICDLAKMPHMLIAGATGSGKSVCINSIICSILYRATPEEVRLILIDPKMVELSVYNDIPHLLVPVVTDPKKAAGALQWVVFEMTQRYKKFSEAVVGKNGKKESVRNIIGYNANLPKGESPMPQIVVVIDELADLMMTVRGEVEESVVRLSQLARAAGIHLVVATQRPSVDVITGIIKANIPSRIAFTTASSIDSRTILDANGAEKLLGNGDMLYAPVGLNKPLRVQGTWISDSEIQAVVDYIRDRHEPGYSKDLQEHIENVDSAVSAGGDVKSADEYLEAGLAYGIQSKEVSTSFLQRCLKIGFPRAGSLIDEMEMYGYVGPKEGTKPRKVLLSAEEFRGVFGRDYKTVIDEWIEKRKAKG